MMYRTLALLLLLPAGALAASGAVEQAGEVVILEGDADLVTADNMGGFGLDSKAGQQLLVTDRFFSVYPDQFDEIVVFTTFDDNLSRGASAYEISVRQDVKGIGRPIMDNSASWAANAHQLAAFVNMMKWDQFEGFGVPMTDPQSPLYATLGQEFAHRWLSTLHYLDANGAVSPAMLGRDGQHWASTLETNASVMDGNQITDNHDGTFTITDSFRRYSALDLYGMGLLDASGVPSWFRVAGATRPDGTAIDPKIPNLRRGSKILGTREDITIEQVIAAEGPRLPPASSAPHAFRVAWVLLTRPGERASAVLDIAAKLEQARRVWEQKFYEFTGGLGSMCTQVSAPCGAPLAQFTGGEIVEAGGNHNGVVEPGEPVWVEFQLTNSSGTDAKAVAVSAFGDVVSGRADAMVAALPSVGSTRVPFLGAVPAGAACGVPVTVEGSSVVGGNTFRGFVQVVPGLTGFWSSTFELDAGRFVANFDGRDDAAANGWEWGTPQGYGHFGFALQPQGGHESQRCWFTGLEAAPRGSFASALGHGTSRLWSLPLDVSRTYQPAIRYFTWYLAVDETNPEQPQVASADQASLLLEGSADGGASWVELDRVSGFDNSWQARDVVLDGKLPLDGTLVLRFTVANLAPNLFIEAGIDDVSISTLTAACNPNASPAIEPPRSSSPSTGCDFGGRAPLAPLPPVVLALAIVALGAARLRRP